MEESSVPSFQSNIARQLHDNEVMRRITPVATDNRMHLQMEIELNEPRQQNAITYIQQNVLQYTGPSIHNTPQQMEIELNEPRQLNAITYNPQNALQNTEPSIHNTSRQPITYNPQNMVLHVFLEFIRSLTEKLNNIASCLSNLEEVTDFKEEEALEDSLEFQSNCLNH